MSTFVDKRGILNHLIPTGKDNKFFSYENILKNSKKLDPWKTFIVKLYSEDGTEDQNSPEYSSVDKSIFHHKNVLPFTRKFNPELLV